MSHVHQHQHPAARRTIVLPAAQPRPVRVVTHFRAPTPPAGLTLERGEIIAPALEYLLAALAVGLVAAVLWPEVRAAIDAIVGPGLDALKLVAEATRGG